MEKPFVVIITIIAALLLLGIIFNIAGIIDIKGKITGTLEDVSLEPDIESLCEGDRRSPVGKEIVFLHLEGDCGNDKSPFCKDKCDATWGACCQDERNRVNYHDGFRCNVPGGSGGTGSGCIIEKISHSQWVYDDCSSTGIGLGGDPGLLLIYFYGIKHAGFTNYKIYKSTTKDPNALDYDDWRNCSPGGKDEDWADLDFFNPCFPGKCSYATWRYPERFYDDGENLYVEVDFVITRKECSSTYGVCPGPGGTEYGKCSGSKEEWHHYDVIVKGYYCCPEGYVWDEFSEKCVEESFVSCNCPGTDFGDDPPAPSSFAGYCYYCCYEDGYHYNEDYGTCYWDYLGHARNPNFEDKDSCVWKKASDCDKSECTSSGCVPMTASITSPQDGAIGDYGDIIDFNGSVNGGTSPYTFSWNSSIDGNFGSSQTFNYNALSPGDHTITFSVTDDGGNMASDSITITVNPPGTLVALITSPEDDMISGYGDIIDFSGSAAGGTSPYAYSWSSDIDGNIGNSDSFSKSDLSIGEHEITLTVTDSVADINTASVEIHIVPNSFDWRSTTVDEVTGNWMTNVKDQGSCGSCWAFATLGIVEAKYNIEQKDLNLDVDLSEQYLVSDCCSSGDCDSGGAYGAANYVKNNGVPDEDCCRYIAQNCDCPDTCDDSAPITELWKINDYGFWSSQDREVIQYILTKGGPIYLSIDDFKPMTDTGRDDKDGCPIYSCGGGEENSHGVVLVGYDNDKGHWIIKNSWGVEDPNDPCRQGYLSINYDTCPFTAKVYVDGVYSENI